MSRKYGTFSSEFLTAIGEATGFFSWPIPYSEGWRRQQMQRKGRLSTTLHHFKKQGWVEEQKRNGKTILVLTPKGNLELLVRKMKCKKPLVWDGHWRVAVFDIPEDCRKERDKLRWLLKKNGFIKLQASVFISPYPLNREAIKYLKETGLNKYIRLIKACEIDDDKDLQVKFKLKNRRRE